MPKKGSVKSRDKAVKKLDKAVKRAIRNGVPDQLLERTVGVAMKKEATKESPVKRKAVRTAGRPGRNATKATKIPDEELE